MHIVEYHSPLLNSTLLAFARQQVTPAYERTVRRGWWCAGRGGGAGLKDEAGLNRGKQLQKPKIYYSMTTFSLSFRTSLRPQSY